MTDPNRRGRRGRLWHQMDFERLVEQREHQRMLRDRSRDVGDISFGAAGVSGALGSNREQPRKHDGRFDRGEKVVKATAPWAKRLSKTGRSLADFAARRSTAAAGFGTGAVARAAEAIFSSNVDDADAEIRRRASRLGFDPDLGTDRLVREIHGRPASETGPDGGRVEGPRPSVGSAGRRRGRSEDRASFKSTNDIAAGFNDPRYARDPAYRREMQRKLADTPFVRVESLNAGLF